MPDDNTPTIAEVRRYLEIARKLIETGKVVSRKASSLRGKLNKCKTEREITPWLKNNPAVLGKLAHARYPHVFQNFPVGTRKPDFVVLDSFSGGWEVTMIELEPPSEQLFTKSGHPAKRLAGAIKQVDDWRSYVEKNRQEVLRRLSEYYMTKDLTYGTKTSLPTDCGGIPLSDVQSVVMWSYVIVIGRRDLLSASDSAKKAEYRSAHGIEIATYDGLVSITDRLEVLPFYYY
jgi:hypothetical protein